MHLRKLLTASFGSPGTDTFIRSPEGLSQRVQTSLVDTNRAFRHPLPSPLPSPSLTDEDNEDNRTMLLQPETRPITLEQLINEVKGIYAGLVMVEMKCVEVRIRSLIFCIAYRQSFIGGSTTKQYHKQIVKWAVAGFNCLTSNTLTRTPWLLFSKSASVLFNCSSSFSNQICYAGTYVETWHS